MDSTNEIENGAVARRWGFLNARLGRPWRGLDASEGLPRSALGGVSASGYPAPGTTKRPKEPLARLRVRKCKHLQPQGSDP